MSFADDVKKETERVEAKMDSAMAKLERAGKGMERVGKKLTLAITCPIILIFIGLFLGPVGLGVAVVLSLLCIVAAFKG